MALLRRREGFSLDREAKTKGGRNGCGEVRLIDIESKIGRREPQDGEGSI
jgi:hypothetical protein